MKAFLELEVRELVRRERTSCPTTGGILRGEPGDVMVRIGRSTVIVPKEDYLSALQEEAQDVKVGLDDGGDDFPVGPPPNQADTNKAKSKKKKSKKG